MAISAWSDSAKQLSGLLFGDPAQRDAALERELNQAKVQRELAETEKLGYENQGLSALGGPEFFKGPDGKLRDVTDIAGAMMRAGKMDAGNFGDMYQALSGMNLNDPSFAATIPNPEQFGRNAALAAGNLANENTAITTGWADSMATRDTNNAIRQRNAQPRSETEVLAAALGSLPMNEQVELARYKLLPDKVVSAKMGMADPALMSTMQSMQTKAPGLRMTTDANGNPVIEYGTEFGELQKSTQGALEKELIAANQLKDTIAKARTLMNDPTNFGSAGALKAFGQDVGQQAQGLGMLFAPEQTQEITSRLQSIGGDIVSADNFSTENVQLNAVYSGLLYQTASALAGQSGRDLSDKDLKLAQQMLGPPQALFSSPQKFGSQLNIVEDLLNLKGGALQKAYDTGAPPRFDSNAVNDISGALAPPNLPGRINSPINPGSVGQGTNPALTTPYDQITPEPVQITSDADYEMLPSGTQFIAPDGTVRVKP